MKLWPEMFQVEGEIKGSTLQALLKVNYDNHIND